MAAPPATGCAAGAHGAGCGKGGTVCENKHGILNSHRTVMAVCALAAGAALLAPPGTGAMVPSRMLRGDASWSWLTA